jgi:hypothetical protein
VGKRGDREIVCERERRRKRKVEREREIQEWRIKMKINIEKDEALLSGREERTDSNSNRNSNRNSDVKRKGKRGTQTEKPKSMTGSRKYDSHSRFNSRRGYDITL